MQAQRDKGLCYNCDEKFGSGHRCKTQQVFILETVADAEESAEVEDASNEEEESATTPEISLHALSGIATPQTIRATGLIKERRLHILIDSGSTHNFVGRKFAKRMECCKAPAAAFQVMVANGERLQCEEVYQAVPVEIQGFQFRTNMYPLDLQGSDLLLRMQWLQGLGKVLHDWSNLTMEFWSKYKKYVLQGEKTGKVTHGSIQSIQKLLANGVERYVLTINKSTENI